MRGFSFSPRQWKRLIDTFLRDGTGTALACECGISRKTAYAVIARIQAVMAADVPDSFRGVTEVDATFVGGVWKNKHIHIRTRGTKRGRGTSKQAIFGIAQRNPNRACVFLVVSENRRETEPHIRTIVVPGSMICSDECGAYLSLKKIGYRHDSVNHSIGEYVRGDVHTQTLDGYWGQLKNHLADKGGVQRQHLARFIGEHVWRYNNRERARKEQAARIYVLLIKIGGK